MKFTDSTTSRMATPGKMASQGSVAMVAWDFLYYWDHRWMHEVRLFWANHVTHHSSERYNLSTALRQPWSGFLTSWVFLPMPLFGIPAHHVAKAAQINLLYQYWIHTEAIDRLPKPIEAVFNTPSHHRVHHGANPQYLDKNYGGILIVWDKLFGTFEPEVRRIKYGLTKNIHTYNPIRIGYHEFVDIAHKVVGVGSVGTRCLIALFQAGDGTPLFLQLKQATSSVLEAHLGTSAFRHAGQRVVEGQRLIQASIRDEAARLELARTFRLALELRCHGAGLLNAGLRHIELLLRHFFLRRQVLVPQFQQHLTGRDALALMHQQPGDLPPSGRRQTGTAAGLHGTGTGIGHGRLNRAALDLGHRHGDRLRARPVPASRGQQRQHYDDRNET